jgi:hypothetical protein
MGQKGTVVFGNDLFQRIISILRCLRSFSEKGDDGWGSGKGRRALRSLWRRWVGSADSTGLQTDRPIRPPFFCGSALWVLSSMMLGQGEINQKVAVS